MIDGTSGTAGVCQVWARRESPYTFRPHGNQSGDGPSYVPALFNWIGRPAGSRDQRKTIGRRRLPERNESADGLNLPKADG